MKYFGLWVLCSSWLTGAVVAESYVGDESTTDRGFVSLVYRDDDGDHRYSLFVPANYSPDSVWPLIVYLHGAGERGNDGIRPTQTGPGPWLREQSQDFPALVLFPQCESTESRLLTGWDAEAADARRVLAVLRDVESRYSVDPEHRVLTGWSMGGYGVWNIAAASPDLWSALVPVSGGTLQDDVSGLADIPVWAIHGLRDNVVRPSSSQSVSDALRAAGGNPWLTVVPNAGHDVWKPAYRSPALYEWMLAPANEGAAPRLDATSERTSPAPPREFEPVLEISNAAEIRLGNRLFSGLSYAIPSRVPSDALTGSIGDIHDTTSADGYWFNVTFARINYSAELSRAVVEAVGKDRLQLQFGLQNVRLTIGNTYIRGSGRSATAGPVTIAIGNRRPVWLTVVVEPYVEDRALKLRAVSSDFNIEYDNWSVSPPWGVSTRGLGMTRSRVSNSIVQGLYARRSRIEREVGAAVPSIMKWVEETLDISDAGKGVAAIWPLPVYRPDVRIWPESVSTDENGASIRLGMAAAAPTDQPLPFRRVAAAPIERGLSNGEETLQLKINAQALEPLSRLLVESRAARVNVLDIPGDAFAPLVSRETLSVPVPALRHSAEDVQIQTELILDQPFSLSDATPGERETDENSAVTLQAPELTFLISTRDSAGDADWQPIAEFHCEIQQQIRATLEELRNASDLRLVPAADPELKVVGGKQLAGEPRDASADETAAFRELLATAWTEWITGQSFADTVIADLDFRKTRLRLTEMRFASNAVVAGFEIPPIAIHNLTEDTLNYELKGPTSGWSKTHTLEPGQSHDYDVDYSVTWRRNTADGMIVYTLKPGSHSEFRYPRAGGPPQLFSR